MNNKLGIISLEAMEFYAHHGYFKEEKKLGNRFTIDIRMTVDIEAAGKNDDLNKTTDYSLVYAEIDRILRESVSLLEHIAYQINSIIIERFQEVHEVTVDVSKHNPPVGGICRVAKVSLTSYR